MRVGVKAIVVACNTATTIAVSKLRQTYDLPVVGIEPGIKPAVETSVANQIVVLATRRTIASEAVSDLRHRFGGTTNIILQACPGLAEQVERGAMDSDATRKLLNAYMQPVFESAADVVVLGCTHFAFLEQQIREIVGEEIVIIEPSRAVARQLDARLNNAGLRHASQAAGSDRFFTSSHNPNEVEATISTLLGRKIAVTYMAEQP